MVSSPSPTIPPTGSSVWRRQIRWALLILVAAMPLHILYLTRLVLPIIPAWDFMMFYTAGRVPLTGQSPYHTGALKTDDPVYRDFARAYHRWARLAEPSPGRLLPWDPAGVTAGAMPKEVWMWHGSFRYPPQAYLLFVPFSRLPWDAAVAAWIAFLTLLALSCGTLCWTFDPGPSPRSPLTQTFVALLFLFNPITELAVGVGQSTLTLCAGVALGQWALRKGHPWLGAFFWSFCAFKPHIGFELLALSLLAGGWSFAARVGVWLVALNALGGVLTTGDPLMILHMFDGGRTDVPGLVNGPRFAGTVGWTRIVYLGSGVAIEPRPLQWLASHLVWMAVVVGAAALRGGLRGSLPYLLAAAACGSLLCTNAHNYDLILLVLMVPYIFWLWDHGHKRDVVVLLGLIAAASVPSNAIRLALRLSHSGIQDPDLIVSYRPFLLLAMAVYLLVRGQPRGSGHPEEAAFPEAIRAGAPARAAESA
jgi:hypothetical protein